MASAVVRLERVSLVDASLTEEQVETIFDTILSKNPEELQLTQLDLREFNISSVSQDKLASVESIVTLTTGMLYDDNSDSDSDLDSDSELDQLIHEYYIP